MEAETFWKENQEVILASINIASVGLSFFMMYKMMSGRTPIAARVVTAEDGEKFIEILRKDGLIKAFYKTSVPSLEK